MINRFTITSSEVVSDYEAVFFYVRDAEDDSRVNSTFNNPQDAEDFCEEMNKWNEAK